MTNIIIMKHLILGTLLFLCITHTYAQQIADYNYDNLNRLTQVIYEGTPQNTVINYTYDELGNRLCKSVTGFSLQLSVSAFLGGPFNGSEMNIALNDQGIVPLSQPYNGTPWNYTGTENVAYIPADVVDWILVELRDATEAASAGGSTMLTRKAAFLLKDGKVVGLDGSSNLIFDETVNQNLFVAIWHRNHLGVLSANPLALTDGIYFYDFKTSAGQAYNAGQKDLGGYYGLYAGDANADGHISSSDNLVWKTEAGTNGYKSTDFNMNSEINNVDKNDKWLGKNNINNQVPD